MSDLPFLPDSSLGDSFTVLPDTVLVDSVTVTHGAGGLGGAAGVALVVALLFAFVLTMVNAAEWWHDGVRR